MVQQLKSGSLCLFVCSVAKSQRSHSDGRWTTDWSRWLWPMMETPTCSLVYLLMTLSYCRTYTAANETTWCQGFHWIFFNKYAYCGRMILNEERRETSKDKNTDWCLTAALKFMSSISIFFTKAFMDSISSSGSLPFLLCHLELPITPKPQLLERVAWKLRFCSKSTIIFLSLSQFSGISCVVIPSIMLALVHLARPDQTRKKNCKWITITSVFFIFQT